MQYINNEYDPKYNDGFLKTLVLWLINILAMVGAVTTVMVCAFVIGYLS